MIVRLVESEDSVMKLGDRVHVISKGGNGMGWGRVINFDADTVAVHLERPITTPMNLFGSDNLPVYFLFVRHEDCFCEDKQKEMVETIKRRQMKRDYGIES